MSLTEIPRIGLLFTSFVELVISFSALALIVFLLKRWSSSDIAMRAYTMFWFFTFFVWLASMIRYVLVSFGHEKSPLEYSLSIIVQMFVYLCGPALFYFVSVRTLQLKSYFSFIFAVPSLCLTLWSFVLLWGGSGVTTPHITYFSADSVVSKQLFYIFGVQIAILLPLLCYDVFLHYRMWRRDKALIEKYRVFHATALIVYLALGTIDQSKIVVGWPLVVFRMFYSAAFLFVYIVISRYESDKESYFLTRGELASIK